MFALSRAGKEQIPAMSSRNIAAIHDRIDELLFEHRLHASSIEALQRRVVVLEAAVRELRAEAFDCSPAVKVSRHQAAPVRAVRAQRS